MVWDGGLEVSVGGSEGAISAVVLSCLLALLFFISPFEFAFGMFIIFISLAMNAKLPNETKTATKRQTKDAGLRTQDYGVRSPGVRIPDQGSGTQICKTVGGFMALKI